MNTIVNQEQQTTPQTTNEGTVAGWKQAYTDVTNGLYQKIYELKQSESVVAELRDELANMENLYNDLQEQVDNYGEPEDLAAERDDLQDQVDDWQEKHTDLEDEIETLCDKLEVERKHHHQQLLDIKRTVLKARKTPPPVAPRKKTPPPVAPRKKSC